MDRLIVSREYQQVWDKLEIHDVASAVAKFLPNDQPRQKVTVQRVTIECGAEPIDAFFKLYQHRDGDWSFWGRASKSRREFQNYSHFQHLDVSAAEPIACCEERDNIGRLRRDFIITRAVPNSQGLAEFLRSQPPREQRESLATQLGDIARRLHAANFFHNDLVWRNILVNCTDSSRPKLFLIDCPRGGISPWKSRRKMLRDLASLDKTAWQLCSRAERLHFLQCYLGKDDVDEETRALARACLDYRRTRWPEDWRGK